MGEFSPPFFSEPPLFFFLIPQILIGSITLLTKIHPPFQNPGSAPALTTPGAWPETARALFFMQSDGKTKANRDALAHVSSASPQVHVAN